MKKKFEYILVNNHVGEPFFLKHFSRHLFVLKFDPKPEVSFKGTVMHLSAFGEEMNKSRAIVTAQARALSNEGFQVFVPDYYGTGDSGGDFSEATWSSWLEDMRFCLSHLREQASGPITLWGLRLGALMAVELASEERLGVSSLLMWNPVLNGEQYMLQFLRLRLMNSMMYCKAKEKIADLKARIEDEGILEVAGYELSKAMFIEICARKALVLDIPVSQNIFWVEVAPSEKKLSVPARKLIERWESGELNIQVENALGPQFWSTQEISKARELIDRTTNLLCGAETTSNISQKEIS